MKSKNSLIFVKLFTRWLIYLNFVVIILCSQNTSSAIQLENSLGGGEGHVDTVRNLGERGGKDFYTDDDQGSVQCFFTNDQETNIDDYEPAQCMKFCKGLGQHFALVQGHRCKCQDNHPAQDNGILKCEGVCSHHFSEEYCGGWHDKHWWNVFSVQGKDLNNRYGLMI